MPRFLATRRNDKMVNDKTVFHSKFKRSFRRVRELSKFKRSFRRKEKSRDVYRFKISPKRRNDETISLDEEMTKRFL